MKEIQLSKSMNFKKNIYLGIFGIAIGIFIYNQILLLFTPENEIVFDPLNATYIIEKDSYTLINGKSKKGIILGLATKSKTMTWGKSAIGDLNSDGADDAALVLVHDPRDNGTFFYVTAALKNPETGQAIGTNAVLLGDRVAPQYISVYRGKVELNYTDRFPWEPFSARPSVGKTKILEIENDELKEIDKPILLQETADSLIKEAWGGCTPDVCEELTINRLDGKDGVWFIEAIYDGLRDDSVRVRKKIAWVHYINDTWELGTIILDEYKCQPNRGHQDFSSELCI